jgi:hypothetical protein
MTSKTQPRTNGPRTKHLPHPPLSPKHTRTAMFHPTRNQPAHHRRLRMAPLIGLIMTTLSLTSCVSWAIRWRIPPPTVGDHIGTATLDVLTLPIQAIAIPTSFALDHHSQSKNHLPHPSPPPTNQLQKTNSNRPLPTVSLRSTTRPTIIQTAPTTSFPKSTACAKTNFGYKSEVAN